MRILADREVCEGIGMCESMDPDRFEVGDDDVVDVLDSRPPEGVREEVAAAVEACPVAALRLEG